MYRTHTLDQLGPDHDDQTVTLSGWVHQRRDHGGLIFVVLRDRYGLTQIVSDPQNNAEIHEKMDKLRSEYVIQVTGTVRKRPEGMTNENMETGGIEVLVNEIEILNESLTPPFEIDQDKTVGEELRLKYRYLDLRRSRMKNNLVMRHKFTKMTRDLFDERGFIEVETPILIKGTPEGSREYIVPSRLYPGKCFVLPQSPQQLKQLLMVSGMDKYFQIARCFRDEDQRGDRQPEFTQLDMEMSFVEPEDVMTTNEEILTTIFEKLAPQKEFMAKPFPRMTWEEAMNKYGSDKPDIRFEMEIQDVSELCKGCGFQVFEKAVENKGVVKALRVPGGAKFSRKDIDDLTDLAKVYGAKGLAYIIVEEGGLKSPITKFFEDEGQAFVDAVSAEAGDIVFFTADSFEIACTSMGNIRLACADRFELRNPEKLAFCWVTDFPLFEFNEEEGRYTAAHHPFTCPKAEDVELLESAPEKVKALAYDLSLNGSEIAGGSIRIHDSELQTKVFKALGISREDAEKRFGHLLGAFKYGAPPHGGIAWGLDRIIMLIQNEPNIREVIAFPKDQKAKDLMVGAPSELPEDQIAEMNVKFIEN
ncbi:aspartate--tRNA ligase [Candidatus Peregrinibacteria bacterium]|jgi:aspartyl-tRNA synthetase|nr:aspartate--tRNA ligase [Candidatus Peregrinibacteria bacterium]MBT7703553.1 aspartate--tRNA ligase [Candidatus Peregrinibacteria bacterium]